MEEIKSRLKKKKINCKSKRERVEVKKKWVIKKNLLAKGSGKLRYMYQKKILTIFL